MTTRSASRREADRGVVPASAHLIGAILVGSSLAFGTVHPGPRLVFAACAVAIGATVAWTGMRSSRPGRVPTAGWMALVACLALSAMAFVPLGPAGRAALQPGLAAVVDSALAEAGTGTHPLALDPRGALYGWLASASCLVLGLGACFVARRHSRLLQLSAWIAATAAVLVVVHLVEVASGLTLIGAFEGVGIGTNVQSWGPFVNHNHAGQALAMALPVAAGAAAGQDRTRAWWFGCAAALIALGVLTTASRSAIALALVSCLVLLALSGHRWGRWVGAGSLVAGVAALAVLGPRRLAEAWTLWLEPGRSLVRHDVLSGRLDTWAAATEVIADAPFVGVGFGGFGEAYLFEKVSPTYALADHAHQEPLQILAEHGVPLGLSWLLVVALLFGWGVFRTARQQPGRRRWLRAGLVAGLVALAGACALDFPLRLGSIAWLGAVLLGALVGSAEHWRRGSPSDRPWLEVTAGLVAGGAAVAVLAIGLARPGGDSAYGSGRLAAEAGEAALARGALDEAQRSFRLAVARRPLDAPALVGLARARFAGGDPEGAIAALDLATAAWPTYATALAARARLHRDAGRRQAAAADYRRVLALDLHEEQELILVREALALAGEDLDLVLPPRADRRCQAARELMRAGQADRAERLYRQSLTAWERCGVMFAEDLIHAGLPDEAVAVLDPLTPGCGTLRARGIALVALSRYDDALDSLDAAMVSCPTKDPALRLAVARARISTGDRSGFAILETLVQQQPDRAYLRRALIRAYRDDSRPSLALPHLRHLVASGQATSEEVATLGRIEGAP